MADTLSTDDYYSKFDTKTYLDLYATEADWMGQMAQTNVEFYSKVPAGNRLLEIGAGPIIFNVIGACQKFKEIYLAEGNEGNRKAIQQWIAKDPKAFDWAVGFKIYAKKMGLDAATLEKTFRERAKGVVACDLTKQPITVNAPGKFDCITTAGELEHACADLRAFQAAVKNIAGMLEKNGTFYITTSVEQSYARVGADKFYSLSLTEAQICDAVTAAGLKITNDASMNFGGAKDPYDISDLTGMSVLTCVKQ